MEGEFYCGPYWPKLDRQGDLYVQALCLLSAWPAVTAPNQRRDQYFSSFTNVNLYSEHSFFPPLSDVLYGVQIDVAAKRNYRFVQM